MAQTERTRRRDEWKGLLANDREFLKGIVQPAVQEILEAEMTAVLQADKGERTEQRVGYRSGYYSRTLVTRVGTLELRVPQDRDGRFSTEVFDRYQRSEKALVCTLAEIYVQGVSTRKVKAVTEQLCGHSVSASTVSRVREELAGQLGQFAERPLEEASPYLVLDARYERVREAGVICSRAVLIAVGITEEGRRCVLGVDLANRESTSSWRTFLEGRRGEGSVSRCCGVGALGTLATEDHADATSDDYIGRTGGRRCRLAPDLGADGTKRKPRCPLAAVARTAG